jgi:hypothetical protein
VLFPPERLLDSVALYGTLLNMETVPFGLIWRLMSWLPGFILRWFFSKQWLGKHVRMDLRPRHDPVLIQGGELPDVQIWLIISNKGHFPVELDRLTVDFGIAGAVTRFHVLKRQDLAANAESEVLVRGALSGEHVAHLKRNLARPNITVQVQAEFNSKIHNFAFDTGQLTGIKPEFISF